MMRQAGGSINLHSPGLLADIDYVTLLLILTLLLKVKKNY